MNRIKVDIEREGLPRVVSFVCPGCGDTHQVHVNGGPTGTGSAWGFNGSLDRPTFTPSLLVRAGHYAQHYKQGDSCWCTYNEEHKDSPSSFNCFVCHSFINDGCIQFLSDCTHHLAGHTVDLKDISA